MTSLLVVTDEPATRKMHAELVRSDAANRHLLHDPPAEARDRGDLTHTIG
jgi:hypothetical protein